MPAWPAAVAAVGAVAAGLAVTLLLFVRGERRRDRARVAGDELLRAAGDMLGAQFRPAAPRSWTGYRAAFGSLHGSASGLSYGLTVNDRRAEDVGHAACISVQAPTGASFTVEVAAARLAAARPGVTMAELFGRRRAQRIPPSAGDPLLGIVAMSSDFSVTARSLTAHSRPSVWQLSDQAEPAPLANFATAVLAAALLLLRHSD